jgi:hypothetical protein
MVDGEGDVITLTRLIMIQEQMYEEKGKCTCIITSPSFHTSSTFKLHHLKSSTLHTK